MKPLYEIDLRPFSPLCELRILRILHSLLAKEHAEFTAMVPERFEDDADLRAWREGVANTLLGFPDSSQRPDSVILDAQLSPGCAMRIAMALFDYRELLPEDCKDRDPLLEMLTDFRKECFKLPGHRLPDASEEEVDRLLRKEIEFLVQCAKHANRCSSRRIIAGACCAPGEEEEE